MFFFWLSGAEISTTGVNLPKARDEKSPLLFKDFRKALNYSFDRDEMTKYLRNGLVAPGNKGFVPDALLKCYNIKGFFYSPDSVKKLLKKVPNSNKKIMLWY